MEHDTPLNKKLIIGILLVSAFTVILNETVMSVALPHLMSDLNITANLAQWLTTAFLLTMAVVIPITGYLLKRYSTRTVFLLAMSSFTIGTLLCALSPSLLPLIGGRVIQAIGTAMMMPLLMTTAIGLVSPEKRGQTMGNISIVISVAPAIGPTLSGIILNFLTWHWIFLMILPIGIGTLLLGYFKLENVNAPQKTYLDIPSIPLSALGFGSLIYGLSALGEGQRHSTLFPSWAPLLFGVCILFLFIHRQIHLAKTNRALLNFSVFSINLFSISAIMMGLAMMCLFGMIILLPLYMQTILQLSPLHSGLLLLPGGLIMGIMARFVGKLFDKIGARKLVIPGSILVSTGLWSMALFTPDTPIWGVLIAHIILSFGLSFLFTPLFTSSLGSLPKDLHPYGSAVLGTIQQICGAAGIAAFVSLMSRKSQTLTNEGMDIITSTAGGLHSSFVLAASLSLLLIITSFFIRRPKDMR